MLGRKNFDGPCVWHNRRHSYRIAARDWQDGRDGMIWFIWFVEFIQLVLFNQTNQTTVFLCTRAL